MPDIVISGDSTGVERRTCKLLGPLGRGVPVLTDQWVRDTVKACRFLDPASRPERYVLHAPRQELLAAGLFAGERGEPVAWHWCGHVLELVALAKKCACLCTGAGDGYVCVCWLLVYAWTLPRSMARGQGRCTAPQGSYVVAVRRSPNVVFACGVLLLCRRGGAAGWQRELPQHVWLHHGRLRRAAHGRGQRQRAGAAGEQKCTRVHVRGGACGAASTMQLQEVLRPKFR